MARGRSGGVRWGAVVLGWVAAVLAGIIINVILRFLAGLFLEFPIEPLEATATIISVALLSGFLAYVVGGYVAGRLARVSGGLNGAMTAVFGLIVGIIGAIILAIFGAIIPEAVAIPPVNFGFTGAALVAGLILFLVNLIGGFIGGKLGGSSGANR